MVFSILEENFPLVFYAKMLSSGSQIIIKKEKKKVAADFSSDAFKNKSSII